jgi:hypothetical protein
MIIPRLSFVVSTSLTKKMQRRFLRVFVRFLYKNFGFMQRFPNKIGGDGREAAQHEHPAPGDYRQQNWGDDRRRQHTQLPAETDIGRGAGAHCRGPCLGDQRHADAELTAQPDTRQPAIEEKIVIAARQPAQPGEDRENDDRVSQHAHPADPVRQHAKEDPAGDRPDQRGGNERSALRRAEAEIRRNHPQHEAEDQQIKAIHRIAERRADQRLDRVAIDDGRSR